MYVMHVNLVIHQLWGMRQQLRRAFAMGNVSVLIFIWISLTLYVSLPLYAVILLNFFFSQNSVFDFDESESTPSNTPSSSKLSNKKIETVILLVFVYRLFILLFLLTQ